VLNRIGSLDEEPDRSVAGQFIQGTPLIGVWDRQGQYSPLPLSPDLKRLAAGGENTEVGTGGEQMVRQAGTGIDQVLAIIEQEQEGARAECGHKGARDRLVRHLADAQARRNHLRHEEGIGDRREIDHPDTIREGGAHLRDNLQGQPGLATAPTPVRVTSRSGLCSTRAHVSATSCSRPIRDVRGAGRLCTGRLIVLAPLWALRPVLRFGSG
jgi:hypothetical protein